ncbi:hypothetical protein AA0113_g2973 [Alternaria arborescens]|uniref:Rhodopsin domain-containing protein n=1 Tax=Alternaria arborescens TaxID=156630 RepID=A0A4Q4SJA1_9PLEO|nr:hypothetical protein AA0113_g2973 [Alternaria arborescens]
MAPPPPDLHLIPAFPSEAAQKTGRTFAGATLALHGIALVVFGARMWSRWRPVYRMQLDDYACAMAYVLIVINTSLLLAAMPYTFTHRPDTFFLSDSQEAFHKASIAQPIWAWSMVFVKVSFSLMLLRISPSKPLRRFLWGMIVLQVTLGVYNTLATLLQCIPVRKAWDLLGTVPGRCWSSKAVRTSSITVSVIHILTDFMLALLPISFLRRIQRPIRERVIVGALMGLGFFAGIASILKIVAAMDFGKTGDQLNESITIGMWSVIEELVGFIVICVPCLRSPFQRALQYCGVISVRIRQHTLTRGYGRTYESDGLDKRYVRSQSQSRLATIEGDVESSFKMKDLGTEASEDEMQWRNSTQETSSGRGEIWCTKEVVVQHDPISRVPSHEHMQGGVEEAWKELDHSHIPAPGNVARAYQRSETAPTTKRDNGVATAPIRRTYLNNDLTKGCKHIHIQSTEWPGLLTHRGSLQPVSIPPRSTSLAKLSTSYIPKSIFKLEHPPSTKSISTLTRYGARWALVQKRWTKDSKSFPLRFSTVKGKYFNQQDNPAYGHDPKNPIEQRQPSTPAQGYNAINPVEQRHDSLTKPGTASASPDGSVPPGWKGSRIPSNNVPRKAPLAARSSDQLSPTTARKTPKGRPERTVSEPIETPEHITRARVRQQQSFETLSGVSTRGILQLNDQNQSAAQPPIGFFAPPQVLPSPAPPKPGRLRPRHTYQVPTELAGTKTALGPDNWDEYVYLMERLHYNEISAHEFDSRAKSIFEVFGEKTRKKLNNILVMKMILPRLEEIELEGRRQTTKSVENN